jgi:hypothetical protein
MDVVRPWPALHEEDRWLTEAMERQLRESTQSSEELRARAGELRAQAERSELKGMHDAALALADRYEQAAAERLSAHAPAASAGTADEIVAPAT